MSGVEDQVELAAKIQSALKKNPELTIADLAEKLKAEPGTVTQVLEEFDGSSATYRGPGLGGGWGKQKTQS